MHKDGFGEDEWQQDDESAIGYNLGNWAISTEGNGCIYTRDMGKSLDT